MENLKYHLSQAVLNKLENDEYTVKGIQIHNVEIERRIGGKRTALAKLQICYKGKTPKWVEMGFEFTQSVGGGVEVIRIDEPSGDKGIAQNLNTSPTPKSSLLETLEEVDKLMLELSNDILRFCTDENSSTQSLQLVQSLATNMHFNIIDAVRDLNKL